MPVIKTFYDLQVCEEHAGGKQGEVDYREWSAFGRGRKFGIPRVLLAVKCIAIACSSFVLTTSYEHSIIGLGSTHHFNCAIYPLQSDCPQMCPQCIMSASQRRLKALHPNQSGDVVFTVKYKYPPYARLVRR